MYNGKDLTKYTEREMQTIRGSEIAMVFQDPDDFSEPNHENRETD